MKHRLIGKTAWKIVDKDVYEIAASMFISTTFGLLGGFMLLGIIGKLYLLPALFVLLPGFLELHGSVFGSFAARLSTVLQLKKIPKRFSLNKVVVQNINASAFLLLIVSVILGLAAYFFTLFIFNESHIEIVFIALAASILSMIVEFPLTIFGTYYSFKKRLDPDDVMGPYVTTLLDIIGIAALLIVINFI